MTTLFLPLESDWLQTNSNHPSAIHKIRDLEASKVKLEADVDQTNFDHPSFSQHLNDMVVSEHGMAHFECRVEPSQDPALKIEFQLNGKPLPTGSKFEPSIDFGFVRLDIKDVLDKDTGILKVIATNSLGTSSTSGCLKLADVQNTTGVTTDTLHPSGQSGLSAIESMENSKSASFELPSNEEDRENITAPYFVVDLPMECHLTNNTLQLNCQVEPKSDANLKIDWFHNGEPLSTGSRVRPAIEFGHVQLTIDDVSERDEGIYTCKASNSLGEATSFTKVYLDSKSSTGVEQSTIHPHGEEGLKSIFKIESKLQFNDEEQTQESIPPNFTSKFEDHQLDVGVIGHFEATLEPKDDGDMKIEWFFNGKSLVESKIII